MDTSNQQTINVQSLLQASTEIPGHYVAFTTYDLCGEGRGMQEAKQSAIAVIRSYLGFYAKSQRELPLPKQQIHTAREFFDYCYQIDPTLAKMHKDRSADDIKQLEHLAQEGVGLADYVLTRSERRIELPENATIRKDETIVVPPGDFLPQFIFEFYKVEKMLKSREESYLC